MNRYRDLNTYFRGLYGERVHKIALDAGLTCPNRDGTIGRGGCIYCNSNGSGSGSFAKGLSIDTQLKIGMQAVAKRFKVKKFMVYFQSFTNTYGPLPMLKKLYETALAPQEVIGLAIGTRPDCINAPLLDLLDHYTDQNLIWLEYGLQSVHDRTLQIIQRGHSFIDFQKAVYLTQKRNIRICAHVIIGLPGETQEDMLATARIIAQMGLDGVKIHLLYVAAGTMLENLWQRGDFRCLDQSEYVETVCRFLELLPPEMVIQRLTSDPHPRELLAPAWALQKNMTLNLIREALVDHDIWQGKKFL